MSRIPTSLPRNIAGLGSQIMTPPQYVNVADVTADSMMQHRTVTHDKVIDEYAEVLRNGGELTPIQIVRDKNGTLWLWDGFHTLEAAKRVGAKKLRAKITPGTKRNAWLNSLGANAKHGIRRTRADLQKTVDDALRDPEVKFSLLNEDQQYNYSSLSALCSVHHSTISNRWNNHHLPLILAEIDREVQGDPPIGVSLQTWLDMVASDLHVPAWLVKQRKIEIGFTPKPTLSQEPSKGDLAPREIASRQATSTEMPSESNDNLTHREIASHQATSTETPKPSDDNLTEREIASHQATSTETPSESDDNLTHREIASHQATSTETPSESDDNLTHREIASHQATSTETPSESDDNLTPCEIASHQATSTETPSESDDNLTPCEIASHQINRAQEVRQPTELVVGSPEYVVVHDPARNQRNSGQELATILTNVASQEYGVKVIEARRPAEGWSQEIGKEIGRVFSDATSDETELAAVLVVLVRK